jgi:hypothetical protein
VVAAQSRPGGRVTTRVIKREKKDDGVSMIH